MQAVSVSGYTLALDGPDGKHVAFPDCLFQPLQNATLYCFLGLQEWSWPEAIMLARI